VSAGENGMKEHLLELVANKSGLNTKVNTVREYLQAYALRIMHDAGVFRSTAFVGGTALRLLYALPRFSEDLDFSLTEAGVPSYTFGDLIATVKQEFNFAGYSASIRYDDEKTVQSAFVKFDGLLFEAGISPHKNQTFSIKIEIDTNPPAGAVLKTDIVNTYFPISFLSYDPASLLAGKTHALLNRKYTKGRDFFDLGWYLSRWKDIMPNMVFLTNALEQTGWTGPFPTADTWREYLHTVVSRTDWNTVKRDVENFLENPRDMEVFSKENLLRLLKVS
jgi:predicted nucleotidyltransferase component of viral defense system